MQDTTQITSVVIVGGGSAGWLTAALLAAKHSADIHITLIESPEVPLLGVGEGTWPTMRGTLQKIGIDEVTFLNACHASFKQGTHFHQWRTGNSNDKYYHPFSLPFNYFDTDCAAWWQREASQSSFAHAVTTQSTVCDHFLAPKQVETPPFAGVLNYGYHLDASQFAHLLKTHAVSKLGVSHIVDHVERIIAAPGNAIQGLTLKSGKQIKGDLFVDCSGFSARLIGEHFGEPLLSCKAQLPNDSAVALQCAYTQSDTEIPSVTHSTAQANGWIWDIALTNRRGVGHVFSSEYSSEDDAINALQQYILADSALAPKSRDDIAQQARLFRFLPGYRQRPWIQNCIAIGTASGFLEPLEASALVMTELAASHLAERLPRYHYQLPAAARQFNREFSTKWARIVDFLKLHYVLSERRDSDNWRKVTRMSDCSEQLCDWLTLWKTRSPSAADFSFREEIFPAASYLYVLYGMGFPTDFQLSASALQHRQPQAFKQQEQHKLLQQHLAGLPGNRTLLSQLTKIAVTSGKHHEQ